MASKKESTPSKAPKASKNANSQESSTKQDKKSKDSKKSSTKNVANTTETEKAVTKTIATTTEKSEESTAPAKDTKFASYSIGDLSSWLSSASNLGTTKPIERSENSDDSSDSEGDDDSYEDDDNDDLSVDERILHLRRLRDEDEDDGVDWLADFAREMDGEDDDDDSMDMDDDMEEDEDEEDEPPKKQKKDKKQETKSQKESKADKDVKAGDKKAKNEKKDKEIPPSKKDKEILPSKKDKKDVAKDKQAQQAKSKPHEAGKGPGAIVAKPVQIDEEAFKKDIKLPVLTDPKTPGANLKQIETAKSIFEGKKNPKEETAGEEKSDAKKDAKKDKKQEQITPSAPSEVAGEEKAKRALPKAFVPSKASNCLFIGNLPVDKGEAACKKALEETLGSKKAKVVKVHLEVNNNGSLSGFGYVELNSESAVKDTLIAAKEGDQGARSVDICGREAKLLAYTPEMNYRNPDGSRRRNKKKEKLEAKWAAAAATGEKGDKPATGMKRSRPDGQGGPSNKKFDAKPGSKPHGKPNSKPHGKPHDKPHGKPQGKPSAQNKKPFQKKPVKA